MGRALAGPGGLGSFLLFGLNLQPAPEEPGNTAASAAIREASTVRSSIQVFYEEFASPVLEETGPTTPLAAPSDSWLQPSIAGFPEDFPGAVLSEDASPIRLPIAEVFALPVQTSEDIPAATSTPYEDGGLVIVQLASVWTVTVSSWPEDIASAAIGGALSEDAGPTFIPPSEYAFISVSSYVEDIFLPVVPILMGPSAPLVLVLNASVPSGTPLPPSSPLFPTLPPSRR